MIVVEGGVRFMDTERADQRDPRAPDRRGADDLRAAALRRRVTATAGPVDASYAAILVAAGRSTRMGSDKLWEDLWGRPAWRWSLDVLLTDADLASVAIAVPADAVDRFTAALPSRRGRCLVVPGGDVASRTR